MKSVRNLSILFLVMSPATHAATVNYVVTGYASGSGAIFDTTTNVSGPNAAGGPTNTVLAAAGAYVDFTIGDANAIVGDKFLASNINALPTVATLRVTLQTVSAGGTEVMIARTLNSQGLEDVGTVTLLLAGLNGVNSNTQNNSATFRFDWRNADNTSALTGSDQIVFSSYDIDFTQRNRIAASDYAVLGTSNVSNLRVTTAAGTTTIVDPAPGTASTVTNAPNAYAFLTQPGDYSQEISVDKAGGGNVTEGYGTGGNQLYMFTFRSPSPLIVAIPEPSSALIAGLGALAMFRRRRIAH